MLGSNCDCGRAAVYQVMLPVGNELAIYELCPACFNMELENQKYSREPVLFPADMDRAICHVCGISFPLQVGAAWQRATCSKQCSVSVANRGLDKGGQPRARNRGAILGLQMGRVAA